MLKIEDPGTLFWLVQLSCNAGVVLQRHINHREIYGHSVRLLHTYMYKFEDQDIPMRLNCTKNITCVL